MPGLNQSQIKRKQVLGHQLTEAHKSFQSALENADTFRQEMRDEFQEYFDNRSENWQEGDKGEAFQSLIDAWDEELEPDETAIDTFNDLPDAPEG